MSKLIEDIVDWDIVNWKKAINYWEKNIELKMKSYSCLELGSNKGGLSLWLALNGNNVICSDLVSPIETASPLHKKYNCEVKINYASINATNIVHSNQFDLVVFKSILGGISRDGKNELKQKTIQEIYNSLKPGGKLLFAENLEASFLHKFLRKKFVKWGDAWNYLKYDEITALFDCFQKVDFITVGFFGAFGRSEKQRNILGEIDTIFGWLIPKKKRYIVVGIAEKK